ncbi:hypothetical protein [Streptomyces sp. AJS327]|nr:hypothetical protein [Streptomyces sp. AJS327]
MTSGAATPAATPAQPGTVTARVSGGQVVSGPTATAGTPDPR